jgi:DNA-binding MarR family transcriptional regulator
MSLDMPTILIVTRSSEVRIPIRRVPIALARRFSQICIAAVAESLEGSGIKPNQYAILAYLDGEPDLDQAGLAARLGVDRTNAGLMIRHLEAEGLIARRVNGVDRRARMLRLTRKGKRLFDTLLPISVASQAKLFASLSERESTKLLDLLVRVIVANETYARPGAGRKRRRTPTRKITARKAQ